MDDERENYLDPKEYPKGNISFFVQAFKIVIDSWKFSIYCYISYEMTDQFLWNTLN